MNLLPNPEQSQLLDAAIEFLRNEAPVQGGESVAQTRARMGRGFWAAMAELGFIGLGVSDEQGGVGYSLAEETLFFREFGRHLLTPAILGLVLGAHTAAAAGRDDLAAGIIAGETLVGVALDLGGAGRIGETVSGPFQLFETDDADLVLFCDAQGAALVAMSALSAAQPAQCLDDRLHLATITLDGVRAEAFVPVAQNDIFRRGVILTAAMLAGVAEASRDTSVDYAKTRQQFGQAIGAFQAIKHRCADMAVRCEAATSSVFHAALCVRDGMASAALDASAAKAFAAEAAMENSSICVQVHGGMGYTEQMTPHLYVKRARVLDQLFGDHRQHLAQVLLAPVA